MSSRHPSTSSRNRPSGAPSRLRAGLSLAAAAERNLPAGAPGLPGERPGPAGAPTTLQQEKHAITQGGTHGARDSAATGKALRRAGP